MATGVQKPALIIGCGALAREIQDALALNNLTGFELACLPADLHNRPERIPEAFEKKLLAAKKTGRYANYLALYGDCGTGGELDRVLERHGVERIAGDHCYAFYSGLDAFAEMREAELGAFYLTDYLTRFFDRLIIQGLGLDRYPQLMEDYFGHYTRLVYLAQTEDAELTRRAEAAADKLGLGFERRHTGLGLMSDFLREKREWPARPSSIGVTSRPR